jgi:hypothetical protein
MTQLPETKPTAPGGLHPINRQLLEYWRGKIEAAAPPPKTAIDPTEIPRILGDLVIYERLEPMHFRVRVVGTRVVARVGVDPTGGNIFELLGQRFRADVIAAMNRVLDEPCIQVTTVRDRFASGREQLVEVLRLPLCDGDGQARFIVSSTAEIDPPRVKIGGPRPDMVGEPIANDFYAMPGLLAEMAEVAEVAGE